MGPMEVDAAYYHCRHCRCGYKPWERSLQLTPIKLTSAAEQITAMAGMLGGFAQGAERVLQKMAGIRLSESTVERTTEAAGTRVAAQLETGKPLGPSLQWSWQKDAMGRRLRLGQRGRNWRSSTGAWRYAHGWKNGLRGDGLQRPQRARFDTAAAATSAVFIGFLRPSRAWPPTAPRGFGGGLDRGGAADRHLRRRQWAGGFLPHVLSQSRVHFGFLARRGRVGRMRRVINSSMMAAQRCEPGWRRWT